MKRTALIASLIASAMAGNEHAAATGFFDQGFTQTPIVRTDYLSNTEGTSVNPLHVGPCIFGEVPCPTLNTVFSQSNYWTQNWPSSCTPGYTCPTGWWTLSLNNEDANNTANPGPPNVSLPRSQPGQGIMGFATLYGNDNFPGDTYWRAHLVLNLTYPNPVYGAIPFLGVGAFTNHGNPTNIASLNPSSTTEPSVLKFDARLWSSTLPDSINPQAPQPQLQTITSWVQIIAKWGTYSKFIQIALWHKSRDPAHPTVPDPYLGSWTPIHNTEWDWRYTKSGFYPGAKVVSATADSLSSYCGLNVPLLVLNQDVHYSIDLTKLFKCMSDHGLFDEPLPTTANIPVITVLWANEATGVNGGLWTDVHNMRVVGTASAGISDVSEEAPALSVDSPEKPLEYGAETMAILRAMPPQDIE